MPTSNNTYATLDDIIANSKAVGIFWPLIPLKVTDIKRLAEMLQSDKYPASQTPGLYNGNRVTDIKQLLEACQNSNYPPSLMLGLYNGNMDHDVIQALTADINNLKVPQYLRIKTSFIYLNQAGYEAREALDKALEENMQRYQQALLQEIDTYNIPHITDIIAEYTVLVSSKDISAARKALKATWQPDESLKNHTISQSVGIEQIHLHKAGEALDKTLVTKNDFIAARSEPNESRVPMRHERRNLANIVASAIWEAIALCFFQKNTTLVNNKPHPIARPVVTSVQLHEAFSLTSSGFAGPRNEIILTADPERLGNYKPEWLKR